MTNINNSISTTLTKFSKLFNNSLESYNKFTESMTSNSKEIMIEVIDINGDVKRIPIVGYQFLLKEIERLNNNINQLSGLSDDKTTVVKIDNSFRKVLISTYKKEADDVNELNTVNSFVFKNNHFFENLLNPSLFVSFDLSDKTNSDTNSVLMERYIFSNLDENDKEWFSTNFLNKNNIDYNTFIDSVYNRGIKYKLDKDTVNLPNKEFIYAGNFSVLNITDVEVDVITNGTTVKQKRKTYKLDKLTYSDLRYNFPDNLLLKVNDLLVLNDDSTAYKITSIDSTSNSVVLELRDGYGKIKIGDNILRYHSENNIISKLDIGIGFDEYIVIFIKPISNNGISSKKWSSGTSFFTNNLLINNNGVEENLESFYKREVIDFGKYLQALAEDKIIPNSMGIVPNATTLNEGDFKVIQINKHANDNSVLDELKQLENEKNRLQAEINELNKALKNNYQDQTLINQKISKMELYNSIVREIDSKATNLNTLNNQKYRIRGFFPIPDSKYSNTTGEQEVIRFLISYRYISSSGNSSPIDQIEFDDNGVVRYGIYSNWVDVYSNTKRKEIDSTTGKLEWIDDKVEDLETVNINSLDIPITNDEIVEIRVKSISEAGYPNNPIMSDWSNIIRIPFPNDLNTNNVVNNIVDNNKKDLIRVDLQNELTSIGVYKHVNTSIEKTDKYFVHTTTDIASGFLTPEQNVVNLFDKLVEYNNKITLLEETINKKIPLLNVKLIDSDGNEISIKKDQQNKIFAGYYTDYTQDLNIIKGKIVTKTYFLYIENLTVSDLQLISRVPGSITKRVNRSETISSDSIQAAINSDYENYLTYDSADVDYLSMRKYDLVPIVLNNPNTTDPKGEIINYPPYQSAQVKSQFVYNRFKDIAKEQDFYSYYIPDIDGNVTSSQILNVNDAENKFGRTNITNSTGFIWGGDFDNLTDLPTKATSYDVVNNDESIEVHINHPYLQNRTIFKSVYNQLTGNTSNDDYINEAKELFKHSKFMTLKSDSELGKKQAIYICDVNERTVKTSFETEDVYLLGKQSCGAYLFMATDVHESISVDGKSLLSKKTVKYGNENSLKIPIIFQFRMSDYYGESDTGSGNVGGNVNQTVINLNYIKEIGFDIYDSNNTLFSFDLEISAKYKQDNLNMDKIPVKKVGMALDDISKKIESVIIRPDNV